MTDATTYAKIEAHRTFLHEQVDSSCDALIAQLSSQRTPQVNGVDYKLPTLADGLDPRNKNGVNLTERGAEMIYRLFDDGAGYNRAAKTMNISQGAAKNRKAVWTKLGGLERQKRILDIDAG